MDFFESQDVARRKTGRLVVIFVAAVLAIIALTYLVVAGILISAGVYGSSGGEVDWSLLADPLLLAAVGCVFLYDIPSTTATSASGISGRYLANLGIFTAGPLWV